MSDHVLELSTHVVEAKTFTIDDAEYKIFGMAHLSKEAEAKTTALFARYENTSNRLVIAPTDAEAEQAAKRLQKIRAELLSTLTTVPLEVAEGLPLSVQVKLIEMIQYEMSDESGADPNVGT